MNEQYSSLEKEKLKRVENIKEVQKRVTSNFSLSSTLVNTQYSVLLTNWIGKPFAKFDLIYKATRDGFKAADFHRCCDQKGFMVSIIRSEHGHVFGVYTELL